MAICDSRFEPVKIIGRIICASRDERRRFGFQIVIDEPIIGKYWRNTRKA